MPGQLTSYISSIINPLQNIQRQLTQQAASYRDAQRVLVNQEQSLVGIGNGPNAFVGLGANSFNTACEQYIAQSERNAQLIDQALQVIGSCIEEISLATTSAEMAFLDETVVSTVLAKITLESLLRDGADAVTWVLNEIVHFCASTGNFFGRSLEHLLSSAVHAVVSVAQDFAHMTNEVWNLLGQIPRVLGQWASAISNAVSHCLSSIESFGVSIVRWIFQQHAPTLKYSEPVAFNNFLKAPNLSNLYNIIKSTEGTNTPITITNLGNNTILVTVAGLDLNHPGYVNNLPNAIDAGSGNANDPYVVETEQAIQKYLKEHGLPPDTKVIIAGHSFGGIVAQYIYQASKEGKTSYSVNQIFTFGSPQVIQSDPHTHEYANANDPVPLLSWYKEGPAASILGLPATIVGLTGLNIIGGPLKGLYTGEKIITDEGNSPFIMDWTGWDHDYSNSKWLQSQPVKFDTSHIGQIENYSGTSQNQALDWTRGIATISLDLVLK